MLQSQCHWGEHSSVRGSSSHDCSLRLCKDMVLFVLMQNCALFCEELGARAWMQFISKIPVCVHIWHGVVWWVIDFRKYRLSYACKLEQCE